jgi:hypothetical protein
MSVSLAQIAAVPAKCGSNVPGIASIELIRSDLVLFIPAANNGVISQNITIASGESTVTWETVKNSAILREERKTNEDFGDFYEVRLSFDFPKIDTVKNLQHINAANQRLSALVTDQNGVQYFIHRLKNRSKSSTGNLSARNGYEWEFSVESKTPAYIFTGTLATL